MINLNGLLSRINEQLKNRTGLGSGLASGPTGAPLAALMNSKIAHTKSGSSLACDGLATRLHISPELRRLLREMIALEPLKSV